jgi:hypothetical protein
MPAIAGQWRHGFYYNLGVLGAADLDSPTHFAAISRLIFFFAFIMVAHWLKGHG